MADQKEEKKPVTPFEALMIAVDSLAKQVQGFDARLRKLEQAAQKGIDE